MPTNLAINGFGRIGRLVLRTLIERYKTDLAVVAVNDMADLKTNAHLFRYDSTYGIYPGKVETGDGAMTIDGRKISVLNQKDPSRLPWKEMGVDIVIEATGVFTDAAQVRAHLSAGAKKAIVTAPATTKTLPLYSASMMPSTIRASTILSPMHHARLTVWRRWPKCSRRTSASSAVS